MSAWVDAYDEFTAEDFPKARRSLQGWRRLKPPQGRHPIPWVLLCAVPGSIFARVRSLACECRFDLVVIALLMSIRRAERRLNSLFAMDDVEVCARSPPPELADAPRLKEPSGCARMALLLLCVGCVSFRCMCLPHAPTLPTQTTRGKGRCAHLIPPPSLLSRPCLPLAAVRA